MSGRTDADRLAAFVATTERRPYAYGGFGVCGDPGPDGVTCKLAENHDTLHSHTTSTGHRIRWGHMSSMERYLGGLNEMDLVPWTEHTFVDPDPPRRSLAYRFGWWLGGFFPGIR